MRPAYWSPGWPVPDRGAPRFWPLYRLRVWLVRRWPALYGVVWFDWR